MCLAGLAKLVERGHLELVEEHGGPLRPQARARAGSPGPHSGTCGAEFFEHRQLAGGCQRGDLLGQVLADALDVGQFRAAGRPRSRPTGSGRSRIVAGRVAIGPDAERVGPLEFQEVGDLVEGGGDFGIGHGRTEGA